MKNDRLENAAWWQRGVVYQIYPRSFMDSNGDGVGDLPGISSKLEYLKWLGVDAIWISPIYPSPMADFGYDVSNYTDVHPLFGTLPQFDELLAKAHALGLRVILDFVPNHTSDRHPWFVESRASKNNTKRNWYIWRDAKPGGGLPNNWPSYFGGPAWTWDERSNQYYLHLFLAQQPDLNWRNPEVKAAMFENLRFWLERGVDGFRIDVVECMIKDAALRDEPRNGRYRADKDEPSDRVLYRYRGNRPEIHELLHDMRKLFDQYGDRVMIGENSPSHSPAELAAYYGNGDELHLPFNFKPIYLPWQAQAFRKHIDAYDTAVRDRGWPNYVLGNHDQHRLASRIGKEQARTAAMLLLTLRGTPTIYYGEEIGMEDGAILPEQVQDPFGIRVPGYSRDPERTPMQWHDGPNAGFSTAMPWLPVHEDYATVNVAGQQNDDTSMLTLYRRLLALRKISPALSIGDYRSVNEQPEDCYVFERSFGDERKLIALNFSANEHQLKLELSDHARVVLSTYLDREEREKCTVVKLRPFEGCILE